MTHVCVRGSFGLTGLTEMVLVNIDGDKQCGVANSSATPLRQGWHASARCECANEPIPKGCGIMPRPPFPYSLFGEQPRLCELREESRLNSCRPQDCKPTTCKVS